MKPDVSAIRQTILQLAVEGKLTHQDPTDEPSIRQIENIQNTLKNSKVKIREINNPKNLDNVELPKNWAKVKLGSILFVTKLAGFEYTKYIKLSDEGEVPVVRAQNVRNWVINSNNPKYISSQVSNLLERSALPKQAVLITFIGANIGQVALFNEPKRWHLAPNVAKVEAYKGTEDLINLKYITLFLLSGVGQSEIFKHMKATAQPSLSMGTIRDIEVLLPPFKEQARIVSKVEELLAIANELEVKSDNLLDNLFSLRKTILKLAFEGKLVPQDPIEESSKELLRGINEKIRTLSGKKTKKENELTQVPKEDIPHMIPESWSWVRLGEYAQIIGGGTPSTSEADNFTDDGGIPWLTPADLGKWSNVYISKGKRNITKKGLQTSSARLLPEGSVLFTSRAPIGHVAIAENEITTNQGFKSLIPYEMNSNKYIYYYLKYSGERINESAPGTTFKEVSGSRLATELLPVPPLPEQHRIVEKLEVLLSICDELTEKLTVAVPN